MYRIRFHGRGGQGMKTASRILGAAFFLEGYQVQDAPRYGAERRGAPIFAYVRAATETIHERGIIAVPDLVIVADDSLVAIPAAAVLQGVGKETVLLIYSEESPETWKERLNIDCMLLTLPPFDVTESFDIRFIGAACAGASARLTGIISPECLKSAIEEELHLQGKEIIKINCQRAMASYEEMAEHDGSVEEKQHVRADDYVPPDWIDIPFEAARISAPAIFGSATSELIKTGLWRTLKPVIDYHACNHCWWLCSAFCPDGAINVGEDGRPEIDYEHCKGCLICMIQCPPHAIRAEAEHEGKGR
ncbi:MAG: 2-oxoacid:acceptor oxidoreductase family protein [Deltaproteobacteria bacterium]|nr:2-oxoacid:acceptor oxidoreductase family protein [Deltaproteobacteria bacterium]